MTMPPLYKILNEVKTIPTVSKKLEALQRAREWAEAVSWHDLSDMHDHDFVRHRWRHLSLRIDGAISAMLVFADYRADIAANGATP